MLGFVSFESVHQEVPQQLEDFAIEIEAVP